MEGWKQVEVLGQDPPSLDASWGMCLQMLRHQLHLPAGSYPNLVVTSAC